MPGPGLDESDPGAHAGIGRGASAGCVVRIGVVVPDLQDARVSMTRVFHEVLYHGGLRGQWFIF
jgi:hypothetical protein